MSLAVGAIGKTRYKLIATGEATSSGCSSEAPLPEQRPVYRANPALAALLVYSSGNLSIRLSPINKESITQLRANRTHHLQAGHSN